MSPNNSTLLQQKRPLNCNGDFHCLTSWILLSYLVKLNWHNDLTDFLSGKLSGRRETIEVLIEIFGMVGLIGVSV